MKKKRKINLFFIAFIIILAIPLIFAATYGSGSYGKGGYGKGETATTITPSDSGAGGGGGGITRQVECVEDSQCNTAEGEICWNNECTKLFDIEILKFESPAELGSFFNFTYLIKGMAEIEGDVIIDFWIEKSETGKSVTSGSDTIYIGKFEEKTKTTELFLPSNTESGVYTFFIRVTFEDYSADSHRTIEISVSEEDGTAEIQPVPEINYGKYILLGIGILIGIAILLILIILLSKNKENLSRFFKEHKLMLLFSALILVLGIFSYFFFESVVRFFRYIFTNLISWIENIPPAFSFISNSKLFLGIIGFIVILVLIIFIIKTIKNRKYNEDFEFKRENIGKMSS